MQLGQVFAQAGFLLGVTGGAVQRPAFAVVAVDTFALQHLPDFIGDAVQQVKRGPALLGGQPCQQAIFAQQIAHQPATVAPGSAKTGGLRLDDHHLELRRVALEVIGGPQPGVAGANNGHIDIQVLPEGRTRLQRLLQLVHP